MSQLFSPYQLGNLTLANRIVIAPMCQYSAENGNASDWHTIHLGQLALSGAALLIIEATAVEPDGRISPFDVGLWSDENEAALARSLEAARRWSDMPIGIQLAHAGRKASVAQPWKGGGQLALNEGGWTVHAPSAIGFEAYPRPPRALTRDDIARLVEAFAAAARRSVRLGLAMIEHLEADGGTFKNLFNTSGQLYRELDVSSKLKAGMTAPEAIDLLSKNGKLVKRPFVLGPNFGLVGFKEDAWKKRF